MATRAGLGRKTNRRAKPAVNEEHHDLILQSDRYHEITGGWLAARVSQRLIQAPSNNTTSLVGISFDIVVIAGFGQDKYKRWQGNRNHIPDTKSHSGYFGGQALMPHIRSTCVS
jgi:hypothetical protein